MVEVLMYYTSGFWVWLGITLGLSIVAAAVGEVLVAVLKRK